jgi:type IV secretory pathway VirB6-like protein
VGRFGPSGLLFSSKIDSGARSQQSNNLKIVGLLGVGRGGGFYFGVLGSRLIFFNLFKYFISQISFIDQKFIPFI